MRTSLIHSDSFTQHRHVIHVWMPGLIRQLYDHQALHFLKIARHNLDPEISKGNTEPLVHCELTPVHMKLY
jgi:hypothetical protein